MNEEQIYAEASRIAILAMGTTEWKGKTVYAADQDPLAYWGLVEMIVDLVRISRGQKSLFEGDRRFGPRVRKNDARTVQHGHLVAHPTHGHRQGASGD